VALEGSLKDLQIQDVFQLLDLGRKSGTLRVRSGLDRREATVCFDRGGVVAAALGEERHQFGARLVRAGRIGEADLARARAVQAGGDGRRLGDILVALGVISRREVDRQAKLQIEEAIFELLAWREGDFRFDEGIACTGVVDPPIRLPTEALLMEAARRLDEWSRIEGTVPHPGVVPRLATAEPDGAGPLDLTPFEWEVLAAVDGVRDVRALADALGRSELEAARAVARLVAAGAVAVGEAASAASGAPDALLAPARDALARGDYAAAAGALEEVLAEEPGLPEACRLLGVCRAALGRHREAAAAWEQWARLAARPGAEEAHAERVARVRRAAETLAEELEALRV
jgi:hypothetical protein